jgi:hypothetical protein
MRYAGGSTKTMLGAQSKTLEALSLRKQGMIGEALGLLRSVQEDLVSLYGPAHPTTHLFSLNLALALEASGLDRDALIIVNEAEPVLRNAMGERAPNYSRLKGIQDRLEARLKQESTSRPRQPGIGITKPSAFEVFV